MIHIQVGNVQIPCGAKLEGTQAVPEGYGEFCYQIFGIRKTVAVRHIVESSAAAHGFSVGCAEEHSAIADIQTFYIHILRGGDADDDSRHVAVGFHGFQFQGVAILGRFLRRRGLCVHVGLGGDVRLDGKVQGIGHHVQLRICHVQIFGGNHTGILAEKFRVHVQPYGHQRVSPVTDDIAPLLTGGGQNQYGVPGGGGVVPLHPVAPVFQCEIFPTEGVLPVPVECAAGVGHFIALIFREGEAQQNEEVPAITAKALIDINADVLTVPHEPFHAQRVAQIPGGAECQRLSLRF